jgi:predicted nucleic acid-binding protein
VILLDTNVVSALMKREPEQAVLEWLNGQPPESIWISSITVFEVRFGLEILATVNASRRSKTHSTRCFTMTWKAGSLRSTIWQRAKRAESQRLNAAEDGRRKSETFSLPVWRWRERQRSQLGTSVTSRA